MNHEISIERQTTAELRKFETELSHTTYAKTSHLMQSAILRGIRAEIESRSTPKLIFDSYGKPSQQLRVHH